MGGMVPLPDEISAQIDKLMSLPVSRPEANQPGNGYHRHAAAAAVASRS
jgi:hypothetical protein